MDASTLASDVWPWLCGPVCSIALSSSSNDDPMPAAKIQTQQQQELLMNRTHNDHSTFHNILSFNPRITRDDDDIRFDFVSAQVIPSQVSNTWK